jgi:hypothetical protein
MIASDEIVGGRPFTHPEFTRREAKVMDAMLAHERELAQGWDRNRCAGAQIVRDSDERERRRLLVVPDVSRLVNASGLSAVGFFGRPRDDVDQAVLFELEDELVARMNRASSLLSYYDIEFVKGAYGNLVLFSTPDGPREWSTETVHRRAVEISPDHYYEVRLHRGSIAGRLLDGGHLAIEGTKYLDFKGRATWTGLRRLSTTSCG